MTGTHLLISLQGIEQVALEAVQLGHIPVQLPHGVDEGRLLIAQPVCLLLCRPGLQYNDMNKCHMKARQTFVS